MLALLACGEAQPPADTGVEPVPYIYDAEEEATPTLTADDVAVRIGEALGGLWDISASPIFPAYHAAMAGSDDGCPNYYEYDGNAYWYDDCESDAGATFSGYAFDYVYADYPYKNVLLNGEALYGVGSVSTSEGSLSFGGSATFYTVTPDLPEDDANWYITAYNQVQGGFAGDGDDAAGTWLEAGEAPDLYTASYYVPSYEGRYIYADGAVTADDGTPVVFDTLALYSANLIPECPDEPYGGMSVRDENGEWYDVVFHGPSEYGAETDPALCDACGDVWYHGELLGSACADFGSLTSWEGQTPW